MNFSRIKILPAEIAEKIAAGEVIERPASVIKELVENSIDAHATQISIHLEDGGKNLIEVIDNGSGMSPDDLKLSIARHATSKIQSLEDLETIGTLGFRGEALPSIAAISDLEIISRQANSTSQGSTASLLSSIRSGTASLDDITFGHFLGSNSGTKIRVQSLFAQVPARLKFLKSATAEAHQAKEWVERLAYTHPEIGFTLTHGDRTLLQLKPETREERVKKLLSENPDFPIQSQSVEFSGGSATLYWIQGMSLPQMRKVIQIVNGRAVRDRVLQQAMLTSFKQALLPGQFPALSLYLKIDPSQIDVNVHPTKTEVRFLNSSQIFKEVARTGELLIQNFGAPTFAASPQPNFSTPHLEINRNSGFLPPSSPHWTVSESNISSFQETLPLKTDSASPLAEILADTKFIGNIFYTYLAFEKAHELILIDQHAAHERVRYEQLANEIRSGHAKMGSQHLLVPEPVFISPESKTTLESAIPFLNSFGFEIEFFSEKSILFRSVPSLWTQDELKIRLANLVEKIVDSTYPPEDWLLDENIFESIASQACRGSVRAGDRLNEVHAQALVNQLFETQNPWNCPHGRPTITRIPRARFEEWFQRRV